GARGAGRVRALAREVGEGARRGAGVPAGRRDDPGHVGGPAGGSVDAEVQARGSGRGNAGGEGGRDPRRVGIPARRHRSLILATMGLRDRGGSETRGQTGHLPGRDTVSGEAVRMLADLDVPDLLELMAAHRRLVTWRAGWILNSPIKAR